MKNFSLIDPSSSILALWSKGLTSLRRSSYALLLYQAYEETLAYGIEFTGIASGGGGLCLGGP